MILSNKLDLFQVPRLSYYCIKDVHKDDSRWLKFTDWVNTISQTALQGFINISNTANKIGQIWLVRNSLVCFWNYSKHMINSEQIIVLLQPLLKSILLLDKIPLIIDKLLYFKLLHSCLSALYATYKSRSSLKSSSSFQISSSKNEKLNKSTIVSNRIVSSGCILTPEYNEILKKALVICERIFAFFPDSGIDYEHFHRFLLVWVKVKQSLNQIVDLDKDFENIDMTIDMKTLIVIQSISNNISSPALSIDLAINLLTNSLYMNKYLIIKLWCVLALLCFKAGDDERAELCLTYGREKCYIILEGKDCHIIKLYSLLAEIETLYAVNFTKFNRLLPNQIIESIIFALKCADKANSVKLVLTNLHCLWNYSKMCHNNLNFKKAIIHYSSTLILLLTGYSKVDQQYYDIDNGLDIKILIFSVILKSFSSLRMWNQGITFVEKALNLIKRENNRELIQFKVLFRAKMNRNVSMDIILAEDELDELVRFDLWMLAAQAYTERKLVFGAYKSAIESIKENSNIYYKLNCKLEFISWLVAIGYQEPSLIILLKECMSSLLHIIVNRINMLNISTENHHVFTFSSYIDTFDLLTLIEIDHLFRMCFMIFLLDGGCSHPLCLSYLQLTLYCVYFMLKSPLNFQLDRKSTLQEPTTKAKICSTKIQTNLSDLSNSFPNNLFEWAQYFPLIDEDILSKEFFSSSLSKPNITLYYLHLLYKEISDTCLSHFQVLPLSLMLFFASNYIDLLEGWSILAQTQMLEFCKKFCFESAFEFWVQKISGKYISQLDKVHFLEANELNVDLKSNSDFLMTELAETENMQLMDYLPFELEKSDYIIYLALETAEVLLKLEKVQEALDIITDCEHFFQHCRKKTILMQLQVLKLRIFSNLCLAIEQRLYIKSILSFQNFNVHFFFDFCLFISKILSYNLVLKLLDSCIKQLRLMKNKKYRYVYSQKQARLEIELATLKLNHFALNNSFGSDNKRDLIDIEILLETIYSSYCIFYSDRNLLQAIKALNQYVLSLNKFVINTMQDSQIYCVYASRMIIFQRKLIIQYQEFFSTLLSISFNFSIEITEHFPLFNEYLFSILTLASLANLIFEWCSKFYIEQKNSTIMSSLKENFVQKYLSVKENFSDHIALLLNNTFCDNTESISLLFSLKMMSKNPKIDFEIGSLMLTLYKHYHMDIFQTWNREYIDGVQSIIEQLDITLVEFNEHQINQAYAISFMSIAKQFLQKFLLYSLTNSINLEECKKISLEIIDLDGVIDVKSSTQLLNLFQSCTVTLYYQSIFDSLIVNPCHSKLALSKIKDKNFSLHPYFPRMRISPDFFNILRDLPSNFRYLILQHSPDKSNLYYAYTKQPPCVLKGLKSTQHEWQPFIGKCKVIEQNFQDILTILGAITADNIQLVNHQPLYFKDIIPAIQAYFHCVLTEICPIISEESHHQDLNLFLLCDQRILSIPIELLFIDSPFNLFKASSRDFSVQFLHHRFKCLQSSATSKDSHKSKDNIAQMSNENDLQYIDISNTSYVIDILNKMDEITTDNFENKHEFLKKSFASHLKVTSKWNGFFGKESYSYMAEKWQILRSSNILFLTSDDFSDFYKLDTIISVKIKEFNLAIILDKAVTIDEVRSIKSDFITKINSYSHIQGILSILGSNIIITNAFPQTSCIAVDIVVQILNFLLKERYKIASAIDSLNEKSMMSNSNDAKSEPLISCSSSYSYNIYGLGHLCIL